MSDTRFFPRTTPPKPAQVEAAGVPTLASLTRIVTIVVVIAALYFGSEVLIPITLAILLSFVLSPLMELLRRLWLGRVPSALLAVLLAIGVIIALGGIIGTQIAGLVEQVPQYQSTIENKITSLQTLISKDVSTRLAKLTGRLGPANRPPAAPAHPAPQGTNQGTGQGTAQKPPAQPPAPQPVPVVIQRSTATSALEVGRNLLGPILHPLATLGIILVVAVFTLLQKEDLRDRMIRLFGSSDLHRATVAMDDAGRRLTRYFLTQLGINCLFGTIVGVGLFFIGVPSPLLWGILGALLRFVPYIGSYIAAALPIVLAAAVGDGWGMTLWTAALYVGTELIMGQAVEPMVYGHSTGLSPFSVIVAAIFWTWVWGPIGLILSTPLTLCLVVLGRHVEQFEFLDIMLGDRPPLSPVENFYQRILAGDPDEAEENAARFLADHSLSTYYDEVALPGLQLAASDAKRGVLAAPHLSRIRESVLALVQELDDHEDADPDSGKEDKSVGGVPLDEKQVPRTDTPSKDKVDAADKAPDWQTDTPVLCIGGRSVLDEAAGHMLAQLLDKRGIGARVVPRAAVTRSQIASLDSRGVTMVCLLYIDIAGSPANLRIMIRRLRDRCPKARILVGLWASDDPFLSNEASRRMLGADLYVSSLADAVKSCLSSARDKGGAPEGSPRLQVVPKPEVART